MLTEDAVLEVGADSIDAALVDLAVVGCEGDDVQAEVVKAQLNIVPKVQVSSISTPGSSTISSHTGSWMHSWEGSMGLP